MLNIVLPMAGRGSRFVDAGYKKPKPLIDVNGKPMIQVVIENLRPSRSHRFIFICQASHVEEYHLTSLLRGLAPDCEIIAINEITEGAACTVLLAKHLIDNADPLMIANSDQYIDIDINNYLGAQDTRALDGMIMTMKAKDQKWSFARVDSQGLVEEVREKEVISDDATVGIYNFASGDAFVQNASLMIERQDKQSGEYYVAPVYNYLISAGLKIGIYDIGSEANGMYGLGTPADLELFLSLPISKNV